MGRRHHHCHSGAPQASPEPITADDAEEAAPPSRPPAPGGGRVDAAEQQRGGWNARSELPPSRHEIALARDSPRTGRTSPLWAGQSHMEVKGDFAPSFHTDCGNRFTLDPSRSGFRRTAFTVPNPYAIALPSRAGQSHMEVKGNFSAPSFHADCGNRFTLDPSRSGFRRTAFTVPTHMRLPCPPGEGGCATDVAPILHRQRLWVPGFCCAAPE